MVIAAVGWCSHIIIDLDMILIWVLLTLLTVKTLGIYAIGRQDVTERRHNESILGMQNKRTIRSMVVYADSTG